MTVVWPLADLVKNLIGKEWPGLSDSGMASDGLENPDFTDRGTVTGVCKICMVTGGLKNFQIFLKISKISIFYFASSICIDISKTSVLQNGVARCLS